MFVYTQVHLAPILLRLKVDILVNVGEYYYTFITYKGRIKLY